jgi:hypothetical protein
MEELCIWRELSFRRITTHECPDFDRKTRMGLIVNQTTCRENGVIQMRREIDPAHELDLTTRIFKGERF